MTRSRRRAVVLGSLAAAAGCCVLAVVLWRQQARTPTGAICGSVWHYRPGHGEPSGGFFQPDELAAATQRCRDAAELPFVTGAVLSGLAVVMLLAGLAVARRVPADAP